MRRLVRAASIALLLAGGLWFGIEALAGAQNPDPREIAFAGAIAFLGLLGNAVCVLKRARPGGK